MEFAFKLDGVKYEVKSLTLDDALLIDREFGVHDISHFDWKRPAYLAALVYLGVREKKRFLSHDALMAEVGKVDLDDLADSILEAMGEDPSQAEEAPGEKSKPKPKRSAKAA